MTSGCPPSQDRECCLYTVVRDNILENFRKYNMPEDVIEFCLCVRPSTVSSSALSGLTIRLSMDYNVPGGKLN